MIQFVPRARVNDLELEYDSFGDPGATPLLLVSGLSYQMSSGMTLSAS